MSLIIAVINRKGKRSPPSLKTLWGEY